MRRVRLTGRPCQYSQVPLWVPWVPLWSLPAMVARALSDFVAPCASQPILGATCVAHSCLFSPLPSAAPVCFQCSRVGGPSWLCSRSQRPLGTLITGNEGRRRVSRGAQICDCSWENLPGLRLSPSILHFRHPFICLFTIHPSVHPSTPPITYVSIFLHIFLHLSIAIRSKTYLGLTLCQEGLPVFYRN